MANNSTLNYGIYDFEKYGYTQAPKPKLNGGHYTGEPFAKNAEYATVQVIPDVDYMMYENLKSARGPDEGRFHYPGSVRPGNNFQKNPGVVDYSNKHNIKCVSNKAIYESKKEIEDEVEGYDPEVQYKNI